jgi:hypothetical protein
MKKRHGQILVLILLIVVVALAVGLSVASRNITNLRTSTQTEHSQRALTAAEGGIEDVLSRLSPDLVGTDISVPMGAGGITATVKVTANNVYESPIKPGEVGQIDLTGATCSSPPCYIQIAWAKSDPSGSEAASIEVVLLKESGGNYTQTRSAWTGSGSSYSSKETGLLLPSAALLPYKPCTAAGFQKCVQIPHESGSIILRIKPFWFETTVNVSSVGGQLPNQKYNITSQASTEIGVTRKVQVERNVLPQLPAVFDFVLYSEGNITK